MMSFFFNDTATTEIYTLSLHDALPIFDPVGDAHELVLELDGARGELERALRVHHLDHRVGDVDVGGLQRALLDRKSTRLNSSHANISYAVFCLKKKKYKFYSVLFFITL